MKGPQDWSHSKLTIRARSDKGTWDDKLWMHEDLDPCCTKHVRFEHNESCNGAPNQQQCHPRIFRACMITAMRCFFGFTFHHVGMVHWGVAGKEGLRSHYMP
mmetsp:Transcript_56916/g.101580  ORF Transcript_56916/g.101580 Transcript_56916/m.101580 type:complete len:102 (-) Transcript_56916:27-332(-)